jgi:hypothetical protein
MADDLAELDVLYGDLTPNRACVYARLPRPADDAGLKLAGQVRGPRCLTAQTLPLSATLVDLGPGPTLLARAIVPDPVFWSPDLPAIYDVTVRLLRGGETIATVQREIGLRSLGARGRWLVKEGKPWVLRGVLTSSTTAPLPRAWHEAGAAYVVSSSEPAEHELLAEASQFGALTVVEIPSGKLGVRELRRLAEYPGVALAVVRGDLPAGFRRGQSGPNLLLGQRITPDDELVRRDWADVLLAETTDLSQLAKVAALGELPIIVVRPLPAPISIDQARSACDRLQRDLAPHGQFAGYVV